MLTALYCAAQDLACLLLGAVTMLTGTTLQSCLHIVIEPSDQDLRHAKTISRYHVIRQSDKCCLSALAFDGHVERRAHLSHAVVAESSKALDEDTDGHALDGIEVDRGSAGNWIVVWL